MKPRYFKDYIYLEIDKPVYGAFVYIREKYLRQAVEKKIKIKVKIPTGTYLISPKKWLKGERIEKEFLIPGEPMIMFGDHLTRYLKQEPEVEPVDMGGALSQMAGTPAWESLRERLHK